MRFFLAFGCASAYVVGVLPPTIDYRELRARRIERALRELASDLADLVRSGDMTDTQANEWMVAKQDQWFGGDS